MTDMSFQGEMARQEACRMFRKVLQEWAMDALSLRRAGLDRPSVRAADRPAAPLRKAA